jgi:hypothetical protein
MAEEEEGYEPAAAEPEELPDGGESTSTVLQPPDSRMSALAISHSSCCRVEKVSRRGGCAGSVG